MPPWQPQHAKPCTLSITLHNVPSKHNRFADTFDDVRCHGQALSGICGGGGGGFGGVGAPGGLGGVIGLGGGNGGIGRCGGGEGELQLQVTPR